MPWFVPHPNWRLTALLLVDLLLVFVIPPLLARDDLPPIIGPLIVLVGTAGTIALVSDHRAVQIGVVVLLLLAAALQALPAQVSDRVSLAVQAGCAALVTVFVGRAVFSHGEVDTHRIAGGIALYLNVALAFAAGYMLLGDLSPAAFQGMTPNRAFRTVDMIHFSLTTLTTLGYGDILPRTPIARSMADLEALIGQLYPATLLARLVSLQISRR